MMNCFSPNDEISFSLLKSIPRKAFHWLSRLEQDLADAGSYEHISWKFSLDCGKFTYANDSLSFSMSWSGDIDDIQEIQASDERACDITNSLDWFTAIEKGIYDQLSSFEQYLNSSDEATVPSLASKNIHTE